MTAPPLYSSLASGDVVSSAVVSSAVVSAVVVSLSAVVPVSVSMDDVSSVPVVESSGWTVGSSPQPVINNNIIIAAMIFFIAYVSFHVISDAH